MCGIAGFIDPEASLAPEEMRSRLSAMASRLRHRGPDADGIFVDRQAGVGFGHRRLSILDLSAAGAQPMQSHCGRYVIAFNGEIYNFRDLREGLEARHGTLNWRGHSDTEVLLELIARDGLEGALSQLDGMFAFALYDRQERSVTLARDPFGEKPLYYGLWNGVLLFASELGAMRAWPGFSPPHDHAALADYFKYSYIPAPASVYRGIFKLPQASSLTVAVDQLRRREFPEPSAYWDMVGSALKGIDAPFSGTPDEALDTVESALMRSCQRRMVSDVPLGAMLSGGIDSSLVVAMMQQGASAPVRTFTIGMDEPGYNETEYARSVATHLGTDHHELVLTPVQVESVIPDIASIYDEPFADSSQIPTFLVSRMARAEVTVALSGDGGDELFAGYNRYSRGVSLWSRLERYPTAMRRLGVALLRGLSPVMINRLVSLLGRHSPQELAAGRAGEKLHKLAGLLTAADQLEFHDRLLTTGFGVESFTRLSAGPSVLASRQDARETVFDFTMQAMLRDTANYLPDDILAKVDRASMAVGLEVRTPFLQRELFELAWSLPMVSKISGGQGKTILRELLYRHVPQSLLDRPKAGFSIPVGRWMRFQLREWAESLFSRSALEDAGIFEPEVVRKLWAEQLSGRRDHETLLWSVLMYQGWCCADAGD